KIHYCQNNRPALYRGISTYDRFIKTTFLDVLLNSFTIGDGVFKVQRIVRGEITVSCNKASVIGDESDALCGTNPEMIIAFWTYLKVFFYLFLIYYLLAIVTFHPEPLWYFHLFCGS